jgi:hypothetical protein
MVNVGDLSLIELGHVSRIGLGRLWAVVDNGAYVTPDASVLGLSIRSYQEHVSTPSLLGLRFHILDHLEEGWIVACFLREPNGWLDVLWVAPGVDAGEGRLLTGCFSPFVGRTLGLSLTPCG